MLTKIKKHPKIFISIIVVLLAAIICGSYQIYIKTNRTTDEKKIAIIIIDEQNAYLKTYEHITNVETLAEALDEMGIAEYQESAFGKYIISLDNILADGLKQEWWGFTINGEFAQTGINETNLNDGDEYIFTFNVGFN